MFKKFTICILILFVVVNFACTTNNKNKEQIAEVVVDSVSIEEEVDIERVYTETEIQLIKRGFLLVADAVDSIRIDLKYATEDNFTKKILYQDLNQAFLHPVAIGKLKKAQQLLKAYNPAYSLLVYDAARPLSVQKAMYDAVRNTRYHLYVAPPSRTSLHNYGLAVDLTIHDGINILDMGTPFDFFGKEAGIYREDEFLKSGIFTEEQVENRRLLRNIMLEAGFQTIRGEWWHFNACSLQEAKERFSIIE